MAIWKISIKYTTKIMGCGQLEKGMFVEYVKNDSFFDPIHGRPEDKNAQNELFKSKYGLDLKSVGAIDDAHLVCEKIG